MSTLTAPTVTGYSPFWSNLLSPTNGATAGYEMSQAKARPKSAYAITKLLNRGGMRDAREILYTVLGAAAGDAALARHTVVGNPSSVEASSPSPATVVQLGGVRPIATITDVDRNTTADDVTELQKWASTTLLTQAITQSTVLGTDVSTAKQVGGTGRF